MHHSITETNAGPTRRSHPVLAITVLFGSALAAIVMVGLSAPARAACPTCPKAVNASASPGQLSSLNHPTAAECIGSDSGTIIDSGFAWLSLSEQGTLALTSRVKGAWHVDGQGSTTTVCFKKSSGTLELWNGTTKLMSKGGSGATTLLIDDRCHLEILAGSKTLWRSGGGCVPATVTRNNLAARDQPQDDADSCLTAGAGTIIDDGTTWLNFESNGDLAAYTSKGKVWHSDTGSNSSYRLCFDDGAYFHVIDTNGNKKWHADGTGDGKGQTLLLTSDCHVRINNSSGDKIWKSGSGGCP